VTYQACKWVRETLKLTNDVREVGFLGIPLKLYSWQNSLQCYTKAFIYILCCLTFIITLYGRYYYYEDRETENK